MIEQLTRQLRRDESVRAHLYFDSEGYATIGVGRLIDSRRGGGLRDSEINLLLANDIEEVMISLRDRLPWFEALNEARQGVLANMAFNLGVGGLLGFSKTLAMVERGEYAAASVEMLDSKWARQVGRRADRLAEQMKTGRWI